MSGDEWRQRLCGMGERHQAAWLLDFVETLQATSRKRKAVLRRAMSLRVFMIKKGNEFVQRTIALLFRQRK